MSNIFEDSCYLWEPTTISPIESFPLNADPATQCNVVFRGIHTEIEAISEVVSFGTLFQYLPEISDYYIILKGEQLEKILAEHPLVKAIILCRKGASSSSCSLFSPVGCKGVGQISLLEDSWVRNNDEFWYEGDWRNAYEWFTAIDPIESTNFKVDSYEGGTETVEYECSYTEEFERFDYVRERDGALYKAIPKNKCIVIKGGLRKYFCDPEERTINLPEGIDKVWEKALIDCKNVETLILPATVKTISEEALSWTDHLKALVCNIPIEKVPKNRQAAAICGFCQAKMDGSYTISEKVNQNYRQYIVANLETLFRKRMDHSILLSYISENMVIAKEEVEKVISSLQDMKKPPKLLSELIAFAGSNAEKIDAMQHLSSDIMKNENPIAEKTIVVTGELVNFPERGRYPQRKKFRALVEKHGGKLGSSITKSTAFLVCNDVGSATVKAKQARENNVPIISEEDFLAMIKKTKK